MIVQCPQCKTMFKLDPERIPGSAVRVRCSRCHHIFTATRPNAADAALQQDALQGAKPPRQARRRFTSLRLLLLIVLLLLVAGIAVWRYEPWSLWQESTSQAGGIELLHLVETRGYFITNQHAGHLFVIEGRVRNEFSTPRRWIRLCAKLYTADGQTAQKLDFYAGNVLSEEQLQNLPLSEMRNLIQTRPPAQGPARQIPAQEAVSFTVPFGNLPELRTLSDYSVEVLASQPA